MAITINIPVSYMIHGHRPGRKQPRSYLYAEIMALEIDEVTSADAPVAVEWSPAHLLDTTMQLMSYSHHAVDIADEDNCQHTVFYKGRHWLRLLEGHANSRSFAHEHALRMDASIQRIENGDLARLFGFSSKTQSQKTPTIVTSDPSHLLEGISRNQRDAAMRAYDDLQLISVDGVLYMACGQPCYALVPGWEALEQSNIRRVPFVDVFEAGSSRNTNWSRVSYIPLSATDLLEETISRLEPKVAERILSPNVRLPESLSTEEDIRLLADHYVHEFMSKSVNVMHKPYLPIDAYFALTSVDDKAAFLADTEAQWAADGVSCKLPIEFLYNAMEVLDERSIGLAPIQQISF